MMEGLDGVLITLHSTNVASVKLTHPNQHFLGRLRSFGCLERIPFNSNPRRGPTLTTFITPWGLYRYKRAPQGYLSSGDGYKRRFADILAHITRLVRCVDDSILYDDEANIEENW